MKRVIFRYLFLESVVQQLEAAVHPKVTDVKYVDTSMFTYSASGASKSLEMPAVHMAAEILQRLQARNEEAGAFHLEGEPFRLSVLDTLKYVVPCLINPYFARDIEAALLLEQALQSFDAFLDKNSEDADVHAVKALMDQLKASRASLVAQCWDRHHMAVTKTGYRALFNTKKQVQQGSDLYRLMTQHGNMQAICDYVDSSESQRFICGTIAVICLAVALPLLLNQLRPL